MRKQLVIGHFGFSLLFIGLHKSASGILHHTRSHGSKSISKSRLTLISFVKGMESYAKTTESNEICRSGHHLGTTFTGTNLNGPNYRIGPEIPHRPILRAVTAAIAGMISTLTRSSIIVSTLSCPKHKLCTFHFSRSLGGREDGN